MRAGEFKVGYASPWLTLLVQELRRGSPLLEHLSRVPGQHDSPAEGLQPNSQYQGASISHPQANSRLERGDGAAGGWSHHWAPILQELKGEKKKKGTRHKRICSEGLAPFLSQVPSSEPSLNILIS